MVQWFEREVSEGNPALFSTFNHFTPLARGESGRSASKGQAISPVFHCAPVIKQNKLVAHVCARRRQESPDQSQAISTNGLFGNPKHTRSIKNFPSAKSRGEFRWSISSSFVIDKFVAPNWNAQGTEPSAGVARGIGWRLVGRMTSTCFSED